MRPICYGDSPQATGMMVACRHPQRLDSFAHRSRQMDTRPTPDVPDGAAARVSGPAAGPERPLGDLFRALSRDAAALVRQELALARAEVKQNLRALARDTILVALGGFVALLGLLVLLAALVVAVGDWMGDRYALGALLVGVLLLAVGGALAVLGLRKAKQTPLAPEETLATLRDTGEWARAEASGIRAALTGVEGADPPRLASDTGEGRRPASAAQGRTKGGAAKKGAPSGDAEEEARAAKERTPLPVSAPLWKRVMHEFKADDLSNQAAKVAYYFFLSLPPALMALFGLTGLFGGAATGDWLTARLTSSLPAEASDLVGWVRERRGARHGAGAALHRPAAGPVGGLQRLHGPGGYAQRRVRHHGGALVRQKEGDRRGDAGGVRRPVPGRQRRAARRGTDLRRAGAGRHGAHRVGHPAGAAGLRAHHGHLLAHLLRAPQQGPAPLPGHAAPGVRRRRRAVRGGRRWRSGCTCPASARTAPPTGCWAR